MIRLWLPWLLLASVLSPLWSPGLAHAQLHASELEALERDIDRASDVTAEAEQAEQADELTLVLSGGIAWNIGDTESASGPVYALGMRLQHGLFLFGFDCGQSTSRVGTRNTGVRSWRLACGPKVGLSARVWDWDLSAMLGVDGVLSHHVVSFRSASEVSATLRLAANAQLLVTYRHGPYRVGPILRFRFGEHYRELQVLIHIGYAFSL